MRVYFYWSPVEPEPGRYAFEAVDAFLEQLDGSDLRLYGPADRVLADLETVRAMMRAFGYEKPLVVGEDNAPVAEPVPEATAAMEQAMAGLYERMADLPPQLQMFMRNLLALSAGVRWPSTGRGRQPGQSPSTHWARRNQPRCSMAA